MAELPGSGSSVPAKIMVTLVLITLLGLGLCGVSAAVSNNALQSFAMPAGIVCFLGGLAGMILFGFGWAVVAIGQKLFGNKE